MGRIDGTILAQSGGISNDAHNPVTCTGAGCDHLDFGSSQVRKAIVAMPNSQTGINSSIVAALCGGSGNPGGVTCLPAGTNDTSHVLVAITNAAATSPANRTYYIAAIG